jgi:flavin-dependent dehydrogenase
MVATAASSRSSCDVAIIGAGPAGCVAGVHLARAGLRVTLIERETFPRFKIGESLLPAGNALLRDLGVWPQIEAAGFVRKYGAEFHTANGERMIANEFAQGLVPNSDYAYQVERSKFDTLLRDRALQEGCEVLQPAAMQTAQETSAGWRLTLRTPAGEETLSARWLLDCSGRDTWLARQLAVPRAPLPYPRRFATYAHFRGVRRAEGRAGGNIIIVRRATGWFWLIPISDELTSVGMVAERPAGERLPPTETWFAQAVASSSVVSERMQEAQPVGDFHVTADYCYDHTRHAGPRWLLAGDAAAFVDPIFSSGVQLAMESARDAAALVLRAERAGRALSGWEQLRYRDERLGRVGHMRTLIDVFYDQRKLAVFLTPFPYLRLRRGVNSIVAGHPPQRWAVRWRFWLFNFFTRLHLRRAIVPPVEFRVGPPAS